MVEQLESKCEYCWHFVACRAEQFTGKVSSDLLLGAKPPNLPLPKGSAFRLHEASCSV